MKWNILLGFCFLACPPARAQTYFEGELDYRNIFLNAETSERLFEDIPQTLTVKGAKTKLDVKEPLPGDLKWKIEDFEKKEGFEFRDSAKIKKDAKDTTYVPKIFEKQLCGDTVKVLPPNKYMFSGLKILDTMMVVSGLNCHVMSDIVNNIKVADYYYYDSIKIDPRLYECPRVDGDDRLYKFINGSLITQRIRYDVDAYYYVLRLDEVRWKKIEDSVFELPKDMEVVPLNK